MTQTRLAAAGLAVLLAAPALAADIHGTVQLSGPPPKAQPIPTTKDQTVCGPSVPDESVLVSNGKLKNVVVTVQGAPKPPPGTEPVRVTIDQRKLPLRPARPGGLRSARTLERAERRPAAAQRPRLPRHRRRPSTWPCPSRAQRLATTLAKPGLVSREVRRARLDERLRRGDRRPVRGDGRGRRLHHPRACRPAPTTVTAWHEKLGEKTGTGRGAGVRRGHRGLHLRRLAHPTPNGLRPRRPRRRRLVLGAPRPPPRSSTSSTSTSGSTAGRGGAGGRFARVPGP